LPLTRWHACASNPWTESCCTAVQSYCGVIVTGGPQRHWREPTIPMGMVVLVGLGVTLGALVIQALAAGFGAEAIGVLLTRRSVGASLWRNSLATFMLIVVLLVGHMAQTAVWATVFTSTGELREFPVAFYHSAVNYTTLGYGDIVMSPRWRLLGPMEAANGTLAFGWSTAVIVTVVIRLARSRHLAQVSRQTED
jgi:ion channel